MSRLGYPNRKGSLTVEKVSELYDAGHTQYEIAAICDVSQARVCWFMKRHDISARVAAKRHQRGALNHQWQGEKAHLVIKQKRVRRRLGKAKGCALCGKQDDRWYQWVSINGNDSDISSYVSACVPCRVKVSNKKRIHHG